MRPAIFLGLWAASLGLAAPVSTDVSTISTDSSSLEARDEVQRVWLLKHNSLGGAAVKSLSWPRHNHIDFTDKMFNPPLKGYDAWRIMDRQTICRIKGGGFIGPWRRGPVRLWLTGTFVATSPLD